MCWIENVRVLIVKNLFELRKAFPTYLENDIYGLLKYVLRATEDDAYQQHSAFYVKINNEEIEIPERHDLFIDVISPLPATQRHIIDCFHTRHYNGFIREKYLRKVVTLNVEWSIPYVMRLLGEYLFDIVEVIYQNRHQLDLLLYREFIKNNPYFYELTKKRVISYWNTYYRAYYTQKNYLGFKVLDFISS